MDTGSCLHLTVHVEHNAHKRQKAEDGGTYLQHNQEHVSTGIYRGMLLIPNSYQ